jgi:sugar O-acyltransferase (sialic acid O-acetyltransferase NeuD family)
MDKSITLIGCAVEYLPVIFDLCLDTYGCTDFHIFKNIQVITKVEMPIKKAPDYTLKYYEPEDSFKKIGNQIFLGVIGPFGKRKVFEHFNEKWDINKEDIGILSHPNCILAPSVSVDNAVLIEPGAIISSQTTLGFAVTIKRKVTIGHHCQVHDFVEINPGVTVSGHVEIGKESIIGSGAVIRNGVSIGENSIIGMGSVVTKDIPEGVIAYGNPCEVIKDNPERDLV